MLGVCYIIPRFATLFFHAECGGQKMKMNEKN